MSDDDIRAQIAKAIDAQREPQLYPFPYPLKGASVQIAVQVLFDEEIDFARIEAQRYCAKIKADLNADPDLLEREAVRQIIWRSVLEPTKGADGWVPLFTSDANVRKLPSTVVESLHRLYLEHQDRVSPMRTVSEAEVVGFAETIRKRGVSSLAQLDHESLVRVAVALAKLGAAPAP